MKRLRSILLTLLALLLLIPLVGIMWPEVPLDFSKDEEPFKSLDLPLKSMEADIIMDGGSVRVIMNDKTGKLSVIHFWIDKEKILNSHPTAGYATKVGGKSILLKDPARAKVITIRLLRDFDPGGDEGVLRALNGLTDPVGDVAGRLYDKSRKRLHEWTGF